MLTVEPRQQTPTVVQRVKRFNWSRFLIAKCALFHLLIGVTLIMAPTIQVLNAGTEPVFALASRDVWGLLFLAAGLTEGALLYYPRMFIVWTAALMVFPLGIAWEAAFALAVLQGHGSALSVIVWPGLYLSWVVNAVRMGLRKG